MIIVNVTGPRETLYSAKLGISPVNYISIQIPQTFYHTRALREKCLLFSFG